MTIVNVCICTSHEQQEPANMLTPVLTASRIQALNLTVRVVTVVSLILTLQCVYCDIATIKCCATLTMHLQFIETANVQQNN